MPNELTFPKYDNRKLEVLYAALSDPRCSGTQLLNCDATLAIAVFTTFPGEFSLKCQFDANGATYKLFYANGKLLYKPSLLQKKEEVPSNAEFARLYIKRQR